MGLKLFKKKTAYTETDHTPVDMKTTVKEDGNLEIVSKNFTMTTNTLTSKSAEETAATWTCWGCGHINTGDTCQVCGKSKIK